MHSLPATDDQYRHTILDQPQSTMIAHVHFLGPFEQRHGFLEIFRHILLLDKEFNVPYIAVIVNYIVVYDICHTTYCHTNQQEFVIHYFPSLATISAASFNAGSLMCA